MVCGQFSVPNVPVDSYGQTGTNYRVAHRFMDMLRKHACKNIWADLWGHP